MARSVMRDRDRVCEAPHLPDQRRTVLVDALHSFATEQARCYGPALHRLPMLAVTGSPRSHPAEVGYGNPSDRYRRSRAVSRLHHARVLAWDITRGGPRDAQG